jgi:Rv0078B-related antitoxin
MREQRFRRENPDANDDVVEKFMFGWWRDRPGAPFGDAEGTPISVDRFR